MNDHPDFDQFDAAQAAKLSKEQFEQEYAARSKVSVEKLRETRYAVRVQSCGMYDFPHWEMRHIGEEA